MVDRSTPTLGFLGVGQIGRPIAEHILRSWPVTICDSDPLACAAFSDRAETTRSAADLGDRSDIVFACLPSLEAHKAAILDPVIGILAGRRCRGLVQIGTTGPALARTLADALSRRGIEMVDAPVTGGVPRARAATLAVIASGSPALFGSCEPMLRSFASDVVYLGKEPGSAQSMKVINNLLSATNLAIACEALVLGAKAGLDLEKMMAVLNAGTGQNSATLTKVPNHVLPRTFDYGGRLELVCKDLKELVEEAQHFGVPMPIAKLVEEIYRTAVGRASPNDDMTTIIRHIEAAAGFEVPAVRR